MSVTINRLSDIIYIIRKNTDEVNVVTRKLNDQSAIQFQDEGANVGTRGAVSTIDFVGSSVSLAIVGGKLTVTITGGSGSASWGSITGTITNQSDLITLLSTYLTIASAASTYQPLDSDLTAIAALTPTNDDIIQRKAGAWTNRTMAQLIADLAALGTTFQPLDSDLTAIAALTTTPWGRSLLTLASAQATIDAISQMTTLGDTVYGGASGTQTRLAGNTSTWRQKKVQTGDGTNSAAPAWVNDTINLTKSGDQTTTSASAQNINNLVTGTIAANKTIHIEGYMRIGCDNTGGVKFAVDVPTGAVFIATFIGVSTGTTAFRQEVVGTDATLTSNAINAANQTSTMWVSITVVLSSTPGAIQLMFASGTATQTSTIYSLGTVLSVRQLN